MVTMMVMMMMMMTIMAMNMRSDWKLGRGIVHDSDANTSGWQVGSDVDNDADDGNDNAGCGGTDCDNCDNWIAATVAPTVNKDNINLNKFTNKVSRGTSNMNTWILLKCMIYSWKRNKNFQNRFHHSPNHLKLHHIHCQWLSVVLSSGY